MLIEPMYLEFGFKITSATATTVTYQSIEGVQITLTGTGFTSTIYGSGITELTGGNVTAIHQYKAGILVDSVTGSLGQNGLGAPISSSNDYIIYKRDATNIVSMFEVNVMSGNDTINGGGGNDVLTGGAGADIFSFTNIFPSSQRYYILRSGDDVITDFVVGEDFLDFGTATVNVSATNTAEGTQLMVDTLSGPGIQSSIFLVGVHVYSVVDFLA